MNKFTRNINKSFGQLKQQANVVKSVINKPKEYVKAIAYGNYDNLPFSMRETLKKVGNILITSLTIIRSPLNQGLMTALNTASGFTMKDKLKNSEYDKLFHLCLRINNKYDLEKEEVVKLASSRNRPNQEILNVDIPSNFNKTINDFIQTTIDTIGINRFTKYDGKNQNCQVFIVDLIRSNGLLNDNYLKFIKQSLDDIVFKSKNPYFHKIMNTITDVGERFNTIKEGLGVKAKNKWIDYVKAVQRKHNLTYKEALQEASKTYRR